MSKESSSWLNNNVLVGMTDKRGNAWHYRAEDQGVESNHYPLEIPVADVQRRLFNWSAVERPLLVGIPANDIFEAQGVDAAGNAVKYVTLEDRKAIVTSDTDEVLGVFKQGYVPHQYSEWLLNNVANILDDTLAISSAGLLRNRAVAWVEVSVPENYEVEGVEFRPNLLACTSFDGSLATTYKRTVQLTVCDNTMAVALSEKDQTVKVRHSKYSAVRLSNAREALGVVFDTADAFSAEIKRLTHMEVNDRQFGQILDLIVPLETDAKGRGRTIAMNKRDDIHSMYNFDKRAATWKGTAFGIVQAFNTYNHHKMNVRDGSGSGRSENTLRAERNMLNAIDGTTDKNDGLVLEAIEKVLQLV